MYKIDLKIKGIPVLMAQLKLQGANIESIMKTALEESSVVTYDALRKNTPYDTGNLHNTMIREVDLAGKRAIIGPDIAMAYYAPFVELGHTLRNGRWLPGQYFLRRTASEMRKRIKDIFSNYITNTLRG